MNTIDCNDNDIIDNDTYLNSINGVEKYHHNGDDNDDDNRCFDYIHDGYCLQMMIMDVDFIKRI